jgi:predicted DNA-binding protein
MRPEYASGVKSITIKLPETVLERLKEEARATGRTVAAIVRERIEGHAPDRDASVYSLTSDLAGTLAEGPKSATNDRRKFRR